MNAFAAWGLFFFQKILLKFFTIGQLKILDIFLNTSRITLYGYHSSGGVNDGWRTPVI